MKFNDPKIQEVVNTMTNWQRNQWAKAGYPTGKKMYDFIHPNQLIARRMRQNDEERAKSNPRT